MPAVSVVMPVYNAEKHIGQALDSLIAQTFTDWECIIVNDGSTDGTLAIIESYAMRDPRFSYTSIKNSGSAKIPRDTAIEKASTEWIMAHDADDFLAPDVIEKLVARQTQTGVDIVCLRLQTFDHTTGNPLHSIPKYGFDYNQVITGKEAMMMTVGGWQIPGNGLCNRNLLLLNSYNNGSIAHFNADEYDTRQMLSMARNVAFVDTVYHYRIHSNSITQKVSAKLFETMITDRMVADLVGQVFGINSTQYKKAEAETLKNIKSKYYQLARLNKHLSENDRHAAQQLIRSERNRYTRSQIWCSSAPLTTKIWLTLPRSIAMSCIQRLTSSHK